MALFCSAHYKIYNTNLFFGADSNLQTLESVFTHLFDGIAYTLG